MGAANKPVVSVVIPAYNYARFLPYTLKSVLAENDVETDVIVVDDGSTDDTAAVARAFDGSVRYVYQENKGLSGARNTGMAAARGEFLVFLDADDLLYPGVLRSQCETLAANPDAKIAVCHNQLFYGNDPEGPFEHAGGFPLPKGDFGVGYCRGNIAPVHAHMLRVEDARRIGEFDTSLPAVEDYDFWLRCAVAGYGVAANPDGLVLYRQHDGSITAQALQQRLHECLLRQRVHTALSENETFLQSQRPDAWLAHASRCLELGLFFAGANMDVGKSVTEMAASALKKMVQEITLYEKNWVRTESSTTLFLKNALIAEHSLRPLVESGMDNLQRMLDFFHAFLPETRLEGEKWTAKLKEAAESGFYSRLYVRNFNTWELGRAGGAQKR